MHSQETTSNLECQTEEIHLLQACQKSTLSLNQQIIRNREGGCHIHAIDKKEKKIFFHFKQLLKFADMALSHFQFLLLLFFLFSCSFQGK